MCYPFFSEMCIFLTKNEYEKITIVLETFISNMVVQQFQNQRIIFILKINT